ncbi:NAD-dependent epimerase/dehydratase family protein, partial [Candidatus Woesearchaeota archaeon]
LIPLFVTNILEGKKVPLYGDGKNVRDWIYVEDHCDAIDLILKEGAEGEIYNIAGGAELENIEITRKILSKLNCDESTIEYVKDRPGHDRRYALDDSKLRALGWKPNHTFEEGIEKTINWYKENQDWWKKLKK